MLETIEFHHAATGRCHHLTWLMHGPTPFMGKIMHVFFNMDRVVGRDFEIGFANLKKLAGK
ncbi:hypothetical protein [Bradyrhizobium sp.]|uniref:hypothetical protein n=1 Tax=Bradyrhizobium sp. TaxID=376 RepID=UPI003C7321BB